MNQIVTKYLKDYTPTNYTPDNINLMFEIELDHVLVTAITRYKKNAKDNLLVLNGSAELVQLKLGNRTLNVNPINDELILTDLPDEFTLEVVTKVDVFNNKSCMGLYASNGNLFTQCEPEGFRKITYYLDRPDVMAKYTTTIIAREEDFPILLSNGNKIREQTLTNGKLQVTWEDPFKKPSYLFALVAGKFAKISDTFITKSGRQVVLEVYSEEASISQCYHCLASLKQAMQWDEERFNLEYDLDVYMIVASGDFNMGAMENKGLNIFNTKYVLADAKTATDNDFINVEAVVGHEYFHNWTGNRVTCRDWFQLSLKEGLTVFRDQEFTSDLHDRAVKRIQDVKILRQLQFTEDASPLSHPVRPQAYIEINNFYTVTVYEKGAELVRMYQTILGTEGFNKGLELYFKRHDGQAVTCENFCQAMADANDFDLSQFMLWYAQQGTPHLKVSDVYDCEKKSYELTIRQYVPTNPQAKAMLIPVTIGLLAANGEPLNMDVKLKQADAKPSPASILEHEGNVVLLVNQTEQTFIFNNVSAKPIPSLLRQFSAPVIIDYTYLDEQLLTLIGHDEDYFNRWEGLQTIYRKLISQLYYAHNMDMDVFPKPVIDALSKLLNDDKVSGALKSLTLSLPSFTELSISYPQLQVSKLVATLRTLKQSLANKLEPIFRQLYASTTTTTNYTLADANKRALKNTLLSYLLAGSNYQAYIDIAKQQYLTANNMTEKFGVMEACNHLDHPIRNELLDQFVVEFGQYPLVMDKWFMLQSQSLLPNTVNQVQKLLDNPLFDATNPNKLYALLSTFTMNPLHFNTDSGYHLISQEVLRIDAFNPAVASRIANGFGIITNFSHEYQKEAKPFLEKIITRDNLSKDVYEIVNKTLAQLNL